MYRMFETVKVATAKSDAMLTLDHTEMFEVFELSRKSML